MKKIMACLIVFLIFSYIALDISSLDKAEKLRELDLFSGTQLGFKIGRQPMEEKEIVTQIPPNIDTEQDTQSNQDYFVKLFAQEFYNHNANIEVEYKEYDEFIDKIEEIINLAQEEIKKRTGISNIIMSYEVSYNSFNENAIVKILYRYEDKMIKAVEKKGKELVDSLITNDMTDYEKVKTIHDYIVNNTKYDTRLFTEGKVPDSSYNAYGNLVNGVAVCQGYTEAFDFLINIVGLESIVVSGRANSSGEWMDHAWNIVKIDDEYYHVDTTWDDPVTKDSSQIIRYDYFNVTDEYISKDHVWNKDEIPVCNSTKYNYYYYNNLVITNKEDLKEKIVSQIKNKSKEIVIKYEGFNTDSEELSKIISGANKVKKYYYSMDNGIIRITDIDYF